MTDNSLLPDPLPIRHIFRWDLDKTYIRTDFDTLGDLLRMARLKPEERLNVPGADALLRELTRQREDSRAYLTFISGSPEQMRSKIERKFMLDGIRPDLFMLKPQLRYIMRGKFRALRGQIGYKLETLLRVRAMTDLAPETLFGDDAEQDAFIYSLYADLAAGRVGERLLREILREANVYPDTFELIVSRLANVRIQENVGRIFINLDRHSAPGRFLVFGPRVVPITNYFQCALVLLADGVLGPVSLLRVAADMVADAGYTIQTFANSYQDLSRRQILGPEAIDLLEQSHDTLEAAGELPAEFLRKLLTRLRALAPRHDLKSREWEGPPDYLRILQSDREMKQALKERPDRKRGLFS